MRLFDNVFVRIFFWFLPFTYALTFDLGFPLKISEIALFILVALIAIKGKFSIPFTDRSFQIFAIFLLITFVSMIVNFMWKYPYPLSTYVSRFGYEFDSILKFFYLILALFAFILASNAFYVNKDRYIRIFLLGGLIASVYSWYLFLSGLLHISPILLPGIDKPQYIGLSFGLFIRSGTFKEGNFMGLFLLFCIVLSFYSQRKKLAYFFMATLITTFSTMALVCAVFFLVCYYFKRNYTRRRLVYLIAAFTIIITLFLSLMGNQDFKVFVLSKFSVKMSGKFSNLGQYSSSDRVNSALVGLRMGIENPVLGVGISNYSRHYNYFNEFQYFESRPTDPKSIPNNIFAEVFSETGAIGLAFFLYLLYLLYKKTRYDESGILRFGFLATLIYFFAFPSFSILYIWVFFGLIASIQDNYEVRITPTPEAD